MEEWQKRVEELALRAYMKGIAVFSDFLSEEKCDKIKNMRLPVAVTFCGGAEYANRKIVRFCGDGNGGNGGHGNGGAYYEENYYYDDYGEYRQDTSKEREKNPIGDFPIKIIKITPLSAKFATPLTHRDFLGAIMGCGVERDKIGDIFTDGFCAYVVTDEKIGEYLIGVIDKVGKNPVKVQEVGEVEREFLPKIEEKEVLSTSLRADCVISAVYKLSREKSNELFANSLVSIGGRVCENNSALVVENQVFSVRGYGKFVFLGVSGTSSKGRKYIRVGIYR